MTAPAPASAKAEAPGTPKRLAPAAPDGRVDAAVEALVRAIDALLPQTQCGQCGYGGCLPYARALAGAAAPINRCPPGGDAGVADLARLLGRPLLALDPSCGAPRALHVAQIDESRCIGCTLCIQACPVDAIVGATKAMHTVVAAECTGCDLCLPPCPMDCIQMVPVQPPRPWTRADADQARQRLHERARRQARAQADQEERLVAKARHKLEQLQLEQLRLDQLRLDPLRPDPLRRDPLRLDPLRPDEPQAGRGAAHEEIARRRGIVERALERVRQRRARDGA